MTKNTGQEKEKDLLTQVCTIKIESSQKVLQVVEYFDSSTKSISVAEGSFSYWQQKL